MLESVSARLATVLKPKNFFCQTHNIVAEIAHVCHQLLIWTPTHFHFQKAWRISTQVKNHMKNVYFYKWQHKFPAISKVLFILFYSSYVKCIEFFNKQYDKKSHAFPGQY